MCKVKEGETTNDFYAFLTTEANKEVGAVHPKAMPVILTRPEEWETWLTAPTPEALKLQRPLADGILEMNGESFRLATSKKTQKQTRHPNIQGGQMTNTEQDEKPAL